MCINSILLLSCFTDAGVRKICHNELKLEGQMF